MREVRRPQAKSGRTHAPDDELGIHYTPQLTDPGGSPAGSIVYVMRADGSARLYRLGDAEKSALSLLRARQAR